ncbi:hypothetical protein KKI17_03350 [Patescibacteria group bacterium]|nr:hypothetical protein [Patescibacteria group bacterium]
MPRFEIVRVKRDEDGRIGLPHGSMVPYEIHVGVEVKEGKRKYFIGHGAVTTRDGEPSWSFRLNLDFEDKLKALCGEDFVELERAIIQQVKVVEQGRPS